MDQYFNQMEKIVKERKTSSRIRFMLQDVIDLRLVSLVPEMFSRADIFSSVFRSCCHNSPVKEILTANPSIATECPKGVLGLYFVIPSAQLGVQKSRSGSENHRRDPQGGENRRAGGTEKSTPAASLQGQQETARSVLLEILFKA